MARPLFIPAPAPVDAPAEPPDALAALTAERVREIIATASALSPRSNQTALGPSELGMSCDRAMAYRLSGTVPTGQSRSDPVPAMVGTGVHLVMAEHVRRLAGRSGRYLIEHPVFYRGVRGSVDLFDRRTRTVTDWKSGPKSKIRRIAKQGPPARSVVQVMTYAAGLIDAGEQVEYVALVYIPTDGGLDDVHADVRPFDRSIADDAVDRYETVSVALETQTPERFPASPTKLCEWCDWYRPGRVASPTGCPGVSLAVSRRGQ